MSRPRIHIITLAGVCCILAILGSPVRSQDASPAPAASPAATAQPAAATDPRKAITTKDPTIPVEELALLVRPLTLEELQSETAAWMTLLKAKATEISNAEIAARRQKLSVDKQREATEAIAKAQKALDEAEKAQAGAKQGTPEYEQATKKVEEAKDQLKLAQAAVKESADAKKDLKQTKGLEKALKEAKKAGELDSAQALLDKTKQDRDQLKAGSPEYDAITKKIDGLDQAIKTYETAKQSQDEAVPNSPEYKAATTKVDSAAKTLVQAQEAITGSNSGNEPKEQSAGSITKTATDLGKTATDTESGNSQQIAKDDKKLDKTIDKLEKSTEADAELKNELLVNVTNLQAEQTALVDRVNVVLNELTNKGGDAEPYRKYIQTISGIQIDAQDTEGMFIRLGSWLKSSEGGLRWAGNIAKFVGIVLATAIASQILAMTVSSGLKRLGTSSLLRQFILMVIRRGGVVLGILLALTALEVSLGPILAVLGGASFVLAFALQSNLGNFASGLMILVNKPFDVGDEVIIGEIWGWVDSITLASTKIKGWKAQIYTVPNNTVWSTTIENLTVKEVRRGVITISVPYSTDLPKVQKMLLDISDAHPLVLKDPAPLPFLWSYSTYSIDFKFGFWTKTDDFWNVWENLHLQIKDRFAEAGIAIAIPQQNVNLQLADKSHASTQQLVSKLNETLKDDTTNHPIVEG